VKEFVKRRTRYLDDMLDKQIAAGCQQVVVLGAGLDTRAVRKSSPDVTYFEIDDKATLELKRARLGEHGMLGDARFIAGNYVTDGLITLLLMNGFDPALPTYVIWEGNTMYLPLACSKAILRQLRANVKSVRVSFDYFARAMIGLRTGSRGLTKMAQNFEA
jgi:methyltransferase (TIGR00027 family)